MKKIILILSTMLVISNTWASDIDQILGRFQTVSTREERLAKFSEIFMGLPYGTTGPLGEGAEGLYDQDPLYRFDTFDCTTFVETITALSLSTTGEDFQYHLNQIRYQNGIIDYTLRNHFPSLDWVPNNVQNGYLEEINLDIVTAKELKLASTLIDKPSFYRFFKIGDLKLVDNLSEEEKLQRLDQLHSEANKFTAEIGTINYIPIPTLVDRPALLNKIPHGTIVNFVRPDWDTRSLQGSKMNVSHQGFLFIKNKKLILRHASSSDKFVVETPFYDYLKKFYNHATLKGVHLMRVK